MGAAIRPAFTRIYQHPHLQIEAISGSTGSELHDHPELQITVLSENGCLEAEWLSGNGKKRRKRFSGPSICVTPGSHSHAMRWSEAANSFVLGVLPDWISNEIGIDCLPEAYGLVDPFVQHLIQLLGETQRTDTSLTRLQAEATAVIMVEHLRRVIRNEAPAVSNRSFVLSRGQLAQVVEYINENLGSDLSIAVLAGIAKMSVSYFARCFKRTIGTTPHGDLVQRRVERAKSLLADGDLPLVEVALACGFATQAHLTTVFRNAVGTTPNNYRRSSRGRSATAREPEKTNSKFRRLRCGQSAGR